MALTLDQINLIENVEAWADSIDFKVDIHFQLMKTKDPVKRKRLENTWNKADRVSNRLAKNLCQIN